MTAIITEKTRRNLATNIFEDIDSAGNEYFICIGRSQDWPGGADEAPTPAVTEREERLFRYNLQAVAQVDTNFRYTVPKYVWTSGTIYSQYNDNVVSHPTTSYYVLTSDKKVYICIKQGKTAAGIAKVSQNVPSHTYPNTQSYADGYVWRYLYTIGTSDYDNFVTSAYMPVLDADSASPAGQIIGYRVSNGGTNYTSTPTVTIIGDGDSAEATAVIYGNQVVEVYPTDHGNNANNGNNYNYANVKITGGGGSGAEVLPIFGPKAGFGVDTKVDLRVSAVMTAADFVADGSGTLVVDNDYRQVGIIKNITEYGSSTIFSSSYGRALKYMTVSSTTNFNADDTLSKTETAGTAQAYVDYVDTSNSRIWYHQNEDTGFIDFTTGSGLSSTSGGSATISSFTDPDVDIFSGDVLYIDNRTAIERTIASNDDIKIVFQI